MEVVGYLFIVFAVALAAMSARMLRAYHRRTGRINVAGAIFAIGSIALWLGGGIYILLT